MIQGLVHLSLLQWWVGLFKDASRVEERILISCFKISISCSIKWYHIGCIYMKDMSPLNPKEALGTTGVICGTKYEHNVRVAQ